MTFGLFMMALAYGAMMLAARGENKPTSAPLAKLPPSVDLSHYGATRLAYDAPAGELKMQGVLPELDRLRLLREATSPAFTQTVELLNELTLVVVRETKDFDPDKGLWQLQFEQNDDQAWAVISAEPPLNCIRFNHQRRQLELHLTDAERYSDRFVKLAALADDLCISRQSSSDDQSPRPWIVTIDLRDFAAAPRIAGSLPEKAKWDADAQTLTVPMRLEEKDRLQVIAAAAPQPFAEAVNKIYLATSLIKVSVAWLLLHYLLATMGELCLSPVGLSLVTKMAPQRHVGLFMGIWFLTTGGVANWTAHFIGSWWGTMTPMRYFMIFAAIALVASVLLGLLIKPLKKMMHGIN